MLLLRNARFFASTTTKSPHEPKQNINATMASLFNNNSAAVAGGILSCLTAAAAYYAFVGSGTKPLAPTNEDTIRYKNDSDSGGRAAVAAATEPESQSSNETQQHSTTVDKRTNETRKDNGFVQDNEDYISNNYDDDDDPYADLPLEDEETDCSLCKTFRQGPCRPFWRKLERCFKDSSSSNDDATNQVSPAVTDSDTENQQDIGDDDASRNTGSSSNSNKGSAGERCLRYFTPHQNCLSNYINLYQLIGLQQKQSLVEDAELAMAPHERRFWDNDSTLATRHTSADDNDDEVRVDWKPWQAFCVEAGSSFTQCIPKNPNSHDNKMVKHILPLWQRLPSDTEPVLVSTPCSVPTLVVESNNTDDKNDLATKYPMILKIAYALDQDGMVLGLAYNEYYMNLLDQTKDDASSAANAPNATAAAASSSEGSTDNSETSTAAATMILPPMERFSWEFSILPGETQSVQIVALYSENPVLATDKIILDALLYKTKASFDLYQGAKAEIDTTSILHSSMEKNS